MAPSASDLPGLIRLHAAPERFPFLALTPDRLELRWPQQAMHPLYVDFNDRQVISRVHAGSRDPLARAIGLHRKPRQTVLDATCGIGRDSATLLGYGCRVRACERSPALLALLRDGLRRARESLPASRWLANWAGLHAGDATAQLVKGEFCIVDTIYLDPMFDAPRRRALPGREMQYLRATVGPDLDAAELLAAARASAARVVLKRHPRQPSIAPPSFSVASRQVCFDVYLNK